MVWNLSPLRGSRLGVPQVRVSLCLQVCVCMSLLVGLSLGACVPAESYPIESPGPFTTPTESPTPTTPRTEEVCNGVDDNGDGQVDEGLEIRIFYLDQDGDQFGTGWGAWTSCAAPEELYGWSTTGGDCDDANAGIHPGAGEDCNGVDDDCDGVPDDGLEFRTWYTDADEDTFGDPDTANSVCLPPVASVPNGDDCNDDDAAVNPKVSEVCDGIDNNCNDDIDEDYDVDGDGVTTCAGDCNDGDPQITPYAIESCNGVDDNCDGKTDDASASDARLWYLDSDGDLYGSSTITLTACTQPFGYSSDSTDCNDGNGTIHPGATEKVGDSIDQNCDKVEVCYKDADDDGYRPDSSSTVQSTTDTDCLDSFEATSTDKTTDCNDNNSAINPGAAEVCNGIDDDCDTKTDEADSPVTGLHTFYQDADLDTYGASDQALQACTQPSGFVSNNTDCNDANPAINPGATEICGNGIDDNCDGTAAETPCP